MGDKNNLTSVKGIGNVIAERLIDNGIDTLEKLATANEEELAQIKGLPSNQAAEIIEEAKLLALDEQKNEETLTDLVMDTDQLKKEVEALVKHIGARFEESAKKGEQKTRLRKEISKTLASLERVEAALSNQLRRLGKGLAKADAKISKVSDSDVDAILAGLKKARKKIDNAIDD